MYSVAPSCFKHNLPSAFLINLSACVWHVYKLFPWLRWREHKVTSWIHVSKHGCGTFVYPCFLPAVAERLKGEVVCGYVICHLFIIFSLHIYIECTIIQGPSTSNDSWKSPSSPPVSQPHNVTWYLATVFLVSDGSKYIHIVYTVSENLLKIMKMLICLPFNWGYVVRVK